ncbi:hypothetical protein K2173_025069 [Erythroxylum novogranatense]|uniref:Uncharacterized protein n=1 Tax=Erythroxylum novogranatense TaxID=1862640 RepID=A0AAV8SVG6_9ROSI|nr:hypothetical protein K2173_025069 [Erythroxylum novogranatense]
MDVKKSNKITDIKKLANTQKSSNKNTTTATSPTSTTNSSNDNNSGSKRMKFIKRTLYLIDVSSASCPTGSLAICVGKELKRYVNPTEYLRHQASGLLLREAEEEFGFKQEEVLKIPCFFV